MSPYQRKKTRISQNLKAYQSLIKHVKKCSEVIKKPSVNDICLNNGVQCLQQQIIPMRSGKITLMRRIACPCPTLEFNYECSKMYCTLDKFACDQLLVSMPKLKNKVKSCNNSRIITKKVFSIFNWIITSLKINKF